MARVSGNVDGRDSVPGGTGGGPCRSVIGTAGTDVGGEHGSAHLAHRYLTTHPGTPCLDGFPQPVIFRVSLLEVREYTLGAVSGPGHQWTVVPLAGPPFSSSCCFACPGEPPVGTGYDPCETLPGESGFAHRLLVNSRCRLHRSRAGATRHLPPRTARTTSDLATTGTHPAVDAAVPGRMHPRLPGGDHPH